MKYVNGNLLDMADAGKFDYIIQGCNCQNAMMSGIAKQIRDRYPAAYLVDSFTSRGDPNKLGKITQAHVYSPDRTASFTIINAYTQLFYGTESIKVDYHALHSALYQVKLLYDMNVNSAPRIGIPMIGAGLAGGDWKRIEAIIDEIGFSDLTCVIYEGAKK